MVLSSAPKTGGLTLFARRLAREQARENGDLRLLYVGGVRTGVGGQWAYTSARRGTASGKNGHLLGSRHLPVELEEQAFRAEDDLEILVSQRVFQNRHCDGTELEELCLGSLAGFRNLVPELLDQFRALS